VDIWCEGFLENVSFELRVKKVEVGLWTVIVVMIGEISLDDWDEKIEKNDQDEVDGTLYEAGSYSK